MTSQDSEIDLLRRAAAGDQQGWGNLLQRHRKRLRRMIALRMDQRLQGRIDSSDVIQEAFLEASARLPEYLRQPSMPFFLWLRFLTGQKLLALHRHHLRTDMRDAGGEVSLYRRALPEASSAALAAHLLGEHHRPSEIAVRAAMKIRLQDALNRMDSLEREVLSLRHIEQLSNGETAQALGIQESAASKHYIRALKHLNDVLGNRPKGVEERTG